MSLSPVPASQTAFRTASVLRQLAVSPSVSSSRIGITMNLPSPPRRLGLPLAMQMIAILVCALVAAQVVTLLLTVLLPPRPAARWDLDDVAAVRRERRRERDRAVRETWKQYTR